MSQYIFAEMDKKRRNNLSMQMIEKMHLKLLY
jgi:hypothetical protein